MSRSKICLTAGSYQRPAAFEPPVRISDDKRNDWFRFENAAEGTDTTHLYIYDAIGGWFGVYASEFLRELKDVKTSNITLHLNSPGGDVFDAVAIYNALRGHSAKVNVEVDALAASAASFIAQAGDTITMNQGSMMMIHDALAMTYGNEKDHTDSAGILSKVSDNIASIYAARAGGSDQDWRSVMKAEAWYTAKEAVDAGLADSVGDISTSASVDDFNLNVFQYAGRDKAPSPFALMNSVKKETLMGKIANEGSKTEEQSPTEDAPVTEPAPQDPPQPTTPGAPGTPVVPVEPNPEGEPETPGNDPQGDPVRASLAKMGLVLNPDNTVTQGVVINGVPTLRIQDIQAHISALEGFQRETREENRKEFVKNLAKQNKISATALEKVTAYALSLKTEDDFDTWAATYEDVLPNPVFGKHVGNSVAGADPSNSPSAIESEIEVARGIVKQMKLSNMPQEKLEKTKSFQFLTKHNAHE